MGNKNFWKQFAIALILFLLGYFTFNSKLFANARLETRVSNGEVSVVQSFGVRTLPICYHFTNKAGQRAA